jgi:D-3-phosphoglycerate dehydrogenase
MSKGDQRMFHIIATDTLASEGVDLLDQAEDVDFELKTGLSKQELLKAVLGQHALLIRSGTFVDREIIESGAHLAVIGRAGIGVDNVDIEAATEHGVIVMNAPEPIAISAAEHTMALLLAVSRNLVPAHLSMINGHWERADLMGIQLYGKRLGIIGLGRIGRRVAERALAFGMIVGAHDPYVSADEISELDIELLGLDALLAQSDFLSLHTIKTPETSFIINRKAISSMKEGIVLVNAARGGLVDEVALSEALANGKIKAAALDVYGSEPPRNNPLIGLPNVLHTPHLGASTIEAQRDVAVQIASQVLDALRGVSYRNVINVDVLKGIDSRRSGI